jgi:hypothetical protein
MTKAQLVNMRIMCRHSGIGYWSTGWSAESKAQCLRLQEFIRSLGVRVEGNKAFCADGVYIL